MSAADCPGLSTAVFLATHAFFALLFTVPAQTPKLCATPPAFFTLNVIGPGGSSENFDSLRASSDGLPRVTVTTVTLVVLVLVPDADASAGAAA